MDVAYLVFDQDVPNFADRSFISGSEDFFDACRIMAEHANQQSVLEVYKLENWQLKSVAGLSGKSDWHFKEECPYNPFKFKYGDAVYCGDSRQVGNIKGRLLRVEDKNLLPPFDMSKGGIELSYVVNKYWFSESELSPVSRDEC